MKFHAGVCWLWAVSPQEPRCSHQVWPSPNRKRTQLLPFLRTIPFPDAKSPKYRYYFDNPAYSWGDGSVLHGMIRLFQPKRLIEIGSGYSSACSLDTIDLFLEGNCEVTFIEPYPALLKELLGKAPMRASIAEMAVQDMSPSFFEQLEAGDILFIDSTHVLRTGSDVCFELFEILPRLAPGVIVHIHDMFWPFEYLAEWVLSEQRSWNEAYLVHAFLQYNAAFEILYWNNYAFHFLSAELREAMPLCMGNEGGSLWIRKKANLPADERR